MWNLVDAELCMIATSAGDASGPGKLGSGKLGPEASPAPEEDVAFLYSEADLHHVKPESAHNSFMIRNCFQVICFHAVAGQRTRYVYTAAALHPTLNRPKQICRRDIAGYDASMTGIMLASPNVYLDSTNSGVTRCMPIWQCTYASV